MKCVDLLIISHHCVTILGDRDQHPNRRSRRCQLQVGGNMTPVYGSRVSLVFSIFWWSLYVSLTSWILIHELLGSAQTRGSSSQGAGLSTNPLKEQQAQWGAAGRRCSPHGVPFGSLNMLSMCFTFYTTVYHAGAGDRTICKCSWELWALRK